MPYKFFISGVEVTCDTLEEVVAAVRGGSPSMETAPTATALEKLPTDPPKPAKGTQGRGPQKAWAEAEAYAAKHNMTKFEARAILKAKKTAAVNAAMKALQGNE